MTGAWNSWTMQRKPVFFWTETLERPEFHVSGAWGTSWFHHRSNAEDFAMARVYSHQWAAQWNLEPCEYTSIHLLWYLLVCGTVIWCFGPQDHPSIPYIRRGPLCKRWSLKRKHEILGCGWRLGWRLSILETQRQYCRASFGQITSTKCGFVCQRCFRLPIWTVFQSSKTGLSLDWNSDGYPFVIQIAILMNVCCACALSLVVVTTAKQLILPFLYKRLSQRQIATHASQRLQIGAMEETDINVHFAHYPARGFHLTWLKPKQSQGASSYLIRFKSNAGNETSLRVKASDTEAHARTVSFFLNLDQAGLSYAKDIYSFSVITLIRSQEAGRTGWSSPVRIEGHWTTAQLPFQVLSAFLPKQNGKVSLSTFLSNACTSCTPPALTLVVENLHVICDREMVEDDFRLELFLGEREKSRKASQEKREQSFLRTSPISIAEWLDSKPRGEGKGWTMEESGQYDGFGVDIREPISLTPPFRDAMRSGTTLHIHMVEKDSDETLGICSIDWVDLLDAYESKRTSIEFTVQELQGSKMLVSLDRSYDYPHGW